MTTEVTSCRYMKQLSIWLICAVLAEQGAVAQNGVVINDDSLPISYLSLDLLQKRGVAIDSRRRTRRLHEVNNSSVSIIPVFQGMGTHYSYIYVGT